MISLSIFCSTQRISAAIFDNQSLISSVNEKTVNNKIDKLPLLVKSMINLVSPKTLDEIFFSKGPGSYTAIRSIKALAQGMSVLSNSKVLAVDSFQIFLSQIKVKPKRTIVFFKDFGEKYFLKDFLFLKEKYNSMEPNFKHLDLKKLEKLIQNELKENKDILFVTEKSFILEKKFSIFKKNFKFCEPNAIEVANACFLGFGSENLDIIYHHTYYE